MSLRRSIHTTQRAEIDEEDRAGEEGAVDEGDVNEVRYGELVVEEEGEEGDTGRHAASMTVLSSAERSLSVEGARQERDRG